MAIRTVVTRGYGNGTFTGTIALVVTRGYAIGAAVDTPDGRRFAIAANDREIAVASEDRTIAIPARDVT